MIRENIRENIIENIRENKKYYFFIFDKIILFIVTFIGMLGIATINDLYIEPFKYDEIEERNHFKSIILTIEVLCQYIIV